MAYSFITPDNVVKRWQDSKNYTDRLTDPFPEFQRIARNEPFEGGDPSYPNVTDGTTASIIQKTPKRVVQQIPTGVVTSDEADDWLHIVAGFIFTNKIIPYANEDYSLFEKAHLIIESGLTFGFGVSYTPFLNHDGYFCPDLTLPYWGDIYLQRGKKSGRSCDYVFIRTWWQKEDVDSLISNEQKLAKQAKARGEKYESTWDIGALKNIRDSKSLKDQQATTPSEAEKTSDVSGIEIVTAFQKGVGAKFYTFNPASKEIVRTKVNKDPRGAMPLDWFFGDVDGTNPLGRGIVELLGGLQNLIDSDMQAYQYNRALALQPPVIKRGNIGNFKFEPNAVLDASNDPNADVVPLKIDTTAIVNYPELYQLQQSQLFNLVASPNSSIPANVGSITSSKTPAGINQQKAALSVDDNAIRKRFEAWFEAWGETAINLYFAERSGTEILQLDKETADSLRKLTEKGKFDLSQLNENDQIIIDYDSATPALKFQVDASTSKMEDNQNQLQGLELVQKFIDASPILQQIVPPEKIAELYNSFLSVSGIEDPEALKIDVEELKQQVQQGQQTQDQIQPEPAPQQTPKVPSESLNYKDAPEDIKRQIEAQAGLQPSQMTSPVQQQADAKTQQVELQAQSQAQPDDQQVIDELRNLGLSDVAISLAANMFSQGATPEQVITEFTQGAVNA